MPEPPDKLDRTYAGDTKTKYTCARCGKAGPMEREVDSRKVKTEQVEGGMTMFSSVDTLADIDPPIAPTLYRCPRCGFYNNCVQIGLSP